MRPGATHARLDRIAAALALFGVLGPLIVSQIGQPGVLNPAGGTNVFFVLYREHEPVFLALMVAFAIGVAVYARRIPEPDLPSRDARVITADWNGAQLTVLTFLVFAITAIGSRLVMHAFPLAMDEWVAALQARVFAAGKLVAPVPHDWRQFARALTPVYVAYDPDQQVWMSEYLPVYSALRALLVGVHADGLLNPALAAVSVPLTYACARRMWPADRSRAWIAVALLVTSSQFLFMSMTGYAMPAHLCLDLLWLYLFLREDRAGWAVAPFVGVLAVGLHNRFPHALFVAPFLLKLVIEKRWGWVAYFGVVYSVGVAGWYAWNQSIPSSLPAGARFAEVFTLPGSLMVAVQTLSFTVMLTWQTPLLAVLLLLAAASWRTWSGTERALAGSVVLSFGFFFLFPSTQGHGWGYRYTYPVLGNMVLLGTGGAVALAHALGGLTTRRLLTVSCLLTLFVQVPVRGWQIEHFVRPFARLHEYIAHLDADVVIIDPSASWYGLDLVRNDPFAQHGPRLMSAGYLRPQDKRALAARFGDRVHLLEPQEVAQFGVPTLPSRLTPPIWPPAPPASAPGSVAAATHPESAAGAGPAAR